MKEFVGPLKAYTLEKAAPEENFVDKAINFGISKYLQSLSREDWISFHEELGDPTLGNQISKICDGLGRRVGGLHESHEAVSLRTMHLVRYLDGTVSRFNGEPSREYYLHVENDLFWPQVDRTVPLIYGLLAHEKYGVELQPIDHSHDETEAWTSARQLLGEFGDYRLYRQTSSAHDQLLDVRYITETVAAA